MRNRVVVVAGIKAAEEGGGGGGGGGKGGVLLKNALQDAAYMGDILERKGEREKGRKGEREREREREKIEKRYLGVYITMPRYIYHKTYTVLVLCVYSAS